MHPIDIVIPWVDGHDPEWLKKFNSYTDEKNRKYIDCEENRYYDTGLLKYWFRGIEKCAPWINKIFFVSDNQIPEWLNTNNPKLIIVDHIDYILSQYLPTFSANPIELNFHRINELSEHFIYFNDDMFLLNPATPDYFFEKRLPKATAIFSLMHLKMPGIKDGIRDIVCNDINAINEFYTPQKTIKKNILKWFNLKYKKYNAFNLSLLMYKFFPGLRYEHYATPYLKSSFEEAWKLWPDLLDNTCKNKFRSSEDVNQYLIYYYQVVTGKFVPEKMLYRKKYYKLSEHTVSDVCKTIIGKDTISFCLNDGNDSKPYYPAVIKAFEEKFPEKSSFEK